MNLPGTSASPGQPHMQAMQSDHLGHGACCQQIWVAALSACSLGQIHPGAHRAREASELLLSLEAGLPWGPCYEAALQKRCCCLARAEQ